ncbi:MAG: PD40 domain-containing protein [Thermoflavifilum aggregans]|nr:PD40 domain-containing protein [Thermoflavifilum aggregans]
MKAYHLIKYAWLLLFMALTHVIPARAQVFGGDPAHIRWKQINTDTLRVIFPAEMALQAERIANIITDISAYHRQSIGYAQKKLNLVLQNQTTLSNGYVMLAPFRAEFQTTPPQQMDQLGSLLWLDFLSVHEYRHALQNMHFNTGLSHLMRIAFGEAGQAFATDVAIPNWFWEGDAVFTETTLTPQGRGRLPAFFDAYRALADAHFPYSWMKLRNGSYRDYVPNHYPLGYLLCAYGRERYSDTLWKLVTRDAAAYKHLFYPFSKALKDYTGQTVTAFYRNAMQYFTEQWKQDKPTEADRAMPLTPPSKQYLNQQYPVFVSNDTLLFVQNSFQKLPVIVQMNPDGKMHPVVHQGIVADNDFDAHAHAIVWDGYRNDPRWGWKDYGVIMWYDMTHKKIKKLTHRTKLFSPALSPDGQKIVAVSVSPDQSVQLKIFDANDGMLLDSLASPFHGMIAYPQFSVDGKSIYYIAQDSAGRSAIIAQDPYHHQTRIITPFTYHPIQQFCQSGPWIFFSGSYSHIQQIYAVSLTNYTIYQVTYAASGCYSPTVSPNGKWLVYSQFTLKGNKLMKLALDSAAWKPVDSLQIYASDNPYVASALKAEAADLPQEVSHRYFTITDYPKSFQLIHIHSWEPILNDPYYGFQVLSDNMLNTLSSSLFYQYNRYEASHGIGLSATYGGWYPIWNVSGQYTAHRTAWRSNGQQIYWNETAVGLSGYLPWNFSGRMMSRYLIPFAGIQETHIQYPVQKNMVSHDMTLPYFYLGLQFVQQRLQALQHIAPHLAQHVYLSWNHSAGPHFAEQLFAETDLYFPGIWPSHSLWLQLAWQGKDTANTYTFSDVFPYARGYHAPFYHQITKWGLNYQFPIAYPDWGFGGIVYFLRMRLNLFYDDSRTLYYVQQQAAHQRFRSAGMECTADTRWWNEYPLSITLRFSHLLDTDPVSPGMRNRWELIIPLQLR